MIFGFFIKDGLNGVLIFSHDFFKEAVQSLLLGKVHLFTWKR